MIFFFAGNTSAHDVLHTQVILPKSKSDKILLLRPGFLFGTSHINKTMYGHCSLVFGETSKNYTAQTHSVQAYL